MPLSATRAGGNRRLVFGPPPFTILTSSFFFVKKAETRVCFPENSSQNLAQILGGSLGTWLSMPIMDFSVLVSPDGRTISSCKSM